MSSPDSRQQLPEDTVTATGILQSIEELVSPIFSVCAPLPSGGGSAGQQANPLRGVNKIGRLSVRERQERTDKLMHYFEAETHGGPTNAEKDGVWFVENHKDDDVRIIDDLFVENAPPFWSTCMRLYN